MLLSIFGLIASITPVRAQSQETQDITEQNTKMTFSINQITLSVTPDGVIERRMNGNDSWIDYNEQYAADVTFLKLVNWNDSFTALIRDKISGEKKIITSGLGNVWMEVKPESFADSNIELKGDEKFVVNDIAVYGDQVYVGCNGGILLTLTPCTKCYKLQRICDFDIASLSIVEDTLLLFANGERRISIPIGDARQNNIEVKAALELHAKGAFLIDVREPDEYREKHYEDSLNIPLSTIDNIAVYDRNTVLIFYCAQGVRAQKALEQAQKMGFVNVYNLGSVDKLLQ